MKKITFILAILTTVAVKTNAQIPNSGFENWYTVGNCLEPTGWNCMYTMIDSSGNYSPVTRSTDHFPDDVGNYSVRIANDYSMWSSGVQPDMFLGWGIMTSTKMNDEPLFPVTGHPKALCGYYKFTPLGGDTMNIDFHLYKNGTEIATGIFQSKDPQVSWTAFKVYLNDTLYASADSARLMFSSCNEPKNGSLGPLGNSVLYIDNISFDTLITSAPKLIDAENMFSVYPNPASDKIMLNVNSSLTGKYVLSIYNNVGLLVMSKTLTQNNQLIDVSGMKDGFYMLEVKSNNYTAVKKLIVQPK